MRKLALFLILVPAVVFGADVVAQNAADVITAAEVTPPDPILHLLQLLQAIPVVGPVLFTLLKGVAIVAPVMTALSIFVQTILAIPEIGARYSGAHDLADKIKFYSDKVVYWLSYFSIRNAKKHE